MEPADPKLPAHRNPAWERDELILACDLTRQNNWRSLSANDAQVIELSKLLQQLPLIPSGQRDGRFRNPNSVARKTANIVGRHPNYRGKPTNGGALDRIVLKDFLEHPEQMRAAAETIRAGILAGAFDGLAADDRAEDEVEALEGRLLIRRHLGRERDRKIRARKLQKTLDRHGRLACEVCCFDFHEIYGERGAGFAECHHVVPLHVSGETKTQLGDLAILCSNCHRMIHRRSPWLTPDALRTIVQGGQQTS